LRIEGDLVIKFQDESQEAEFIEQIPKKFNIILSGSSLPLTFKSKSKKTLVFSYATYVPTFYTSKLRLRETDYQHPDKDFAAVLYNLFPSSSSLEFRS
jgi:hypothetical protein